MVTWHRSPFSAGPRTNFLAHQRTRARSNEKLACTLTIQRAMPKSQKHRSYPHSCQLHKKTGERRRGRGKEKERERHKDTGRMRSRENGI